jgi:hypothetical protein
VCEGHEDVALVPPCGGVKQQHTFVFFVRPFSPSRPHLPQSAVTLLITLLYTKEKETLSDAHEWNDD